MSEYILCVFEGEKTEKLYFDSLKKAYFDADENVFFKTCYGNDIYELYEDIKVDQDLDIVELIRESETVPKNRLILEGIERDKITQVYLFFDFECHDEKFCPTKICKMLEIFCDETDMGKLFVSYPMLEAIRDIAEEEDFLTRTITVNECRFYKRISADRGDEIFKHIRKLGLKQWKFLLRTNTKKANFLIYDKAILKPIYDQNLIARNQIDKYFIPKKEVFVLSSFPIFLGNYFGNSIFRNN